MPVVSSNLIFSMSVLAIIISMVAGAVSEVSGIILFWVAMGLAVGLEIVSPIIIKSESR